MVEDLACYESVRLFVERAQYRRSSFELTPDNALAVAEVCRRLEGIPLAIELAAARVGVLSIGQISGRLKDSLGVLAGGSRTAEPRQRTLRGALEWSYELLGELERYLYGRLSTFWGGWSLEAAEAVGAGRGIEEEDVLDLLGRLVDKSLVVAESGDPEGDLRYRMLEPVRQYGREKLEESGEKDEVGRRHALFFLALAEEIEPKINTADRPRWLERLENEHGNLRAALAWSRKEAQGETGLRLAGALFWFWFHRGYLSEGRRWLGGALATEEGIGGLPAPASAAARAKTLCGAGLLAWMQGDLSVRGERDALAESGRKAGISPGAAYPEPCGAGPRRHRSSPLPGRGECGAISGKQRRVWSRYITRHPGDHCSDSGRIWSGAVFARRERSDLPGKRRRLGPLPGAEEPGDRSP
jgi:hypothetical protein